MSFKSDKYVIYVHSVSLSFLIFFVVITFLKEDAISKSIELYNESPDVVYDFYKEKDYKEPSGNFPVVFFADAPDYYDEIDALLEHNDYIAVNSIYEPRKFLYIEKYSEVLKENENLPVLNRGFRSFLSDDEVKVNNNVYIGNRYIFSMFWFDEISVNNIIMDFRSTGSVTIFNSEELSRMFTYFHEMAHSHTLQNILDNVMRSDINKHSRIFSAQIKEAHSDIVSLLSMAKLRDLNPFEFQIMLENFKYFRKSKNAYVHTNLTTHNVRKNLLRFSEDHQAYYNTIKKLSYEALPYFVFDYLRGSEYNSNIAHLLERSEHCYEGNYCDDFEIMSMVLAFEHYEEKFKNKKPSNNNEFHLGTQEETRKEFYHNYEKLKPMLEKKKRLIEQNLEEVMLLTASSEDNSMEFLLEKYKNFPN